MKKIARIAAEFRVTASLMDKITDTVPSAALYNNASTSNVIIDLNEIHTILIDDSDLECEQRQPLNELVSSITEGTDLEAMLLAGFDQLEVYL